MSDHDADASGPTDGDGATTVAGLAESLAVLRREVEALQTEVARLDADLDESRRLNLRAAELLDVVYEQLGRPAA